MTFHTIAFTATGFYLTRLAPGSDTTNLKTFKYLGTLEADPSLKTSHGGVTASRFSLTLV